MISKTFIWDKNIIWFVGTMFPYSGMTNNHRKIHKKQKKDRNYLAFGLKHNHWMIH